MKKLFPWTIIVSLPFVLMSCFSDHSDHHDKLSAQESSAERLELTKEVQEQALKVFEANFLVHQAFVADNVEQIKEAAKNLTQVYSNVSTLKTMDELQQMMDALHLMDTLESSSELADAFSSVNDVMIGYLKKYNLAAAFNIYYCPMVDKRWIQNSAQVSEVQNPYALYMLKCGTRESSFNI